MKMKKIPVNAFSYCEYFRVVKPDAESIEFSREEVEIPGIYISKA